ncbi:hypothetical protein [Streptomyces sp. VRA16 Mangrove soil]|uniref:hypothetical protein n=1 Tax=Streptomyces sp. VRA16 Mangrove soil TaxID=2817434 RepID=UPI001A9EC90C|nr:hypothetical protein [Streptomyces sp. VRA16 Mangrove soil]MBO1329984.1 hypothetical protein [Streptomyces sp. VRA16 Mangrove soil]
MDRSDEMWRRFLKDSERAIRRTAPREPSARERAEAAGRHGDSGDAREGSVPVGFELVGEAWQPDPNPAYAPWSDLDGRGRLRRAATLLGVCAVLVAALASVARLPIGAGPDAGRPAGVHLGQTEEASDGLPTASPVR